MSAQHSSIASTCSRPARRGLTLVEMMVSVTITLLVVFAIVQVFDIMGQTVAKGRATIEMAGQLRNVTNTLQRDLDNLTCPVEPWIDPDAGVGYFEYIEGPAEVRFSIDRASRSSDWNALADLNTPVASAYSPFGDVDDILCMTVRADGEPFTGRAPEPGNTGNTITVTSNVAEVIWWMATYDIGNDGPSADDPTLLLRRVLLVLPSQSLTGLVASRDYPNFFRFYDISARYDGTNMLANSLSDLTDPKNRYAHRSGDNSNPPLDFPHEIALEVPGSSDIMNIGMPYLFQHERLVRVLPGPPLSGPNYAFTSSIIPRVLTPTTIEDYADFIVLNDAIGFDVRAYDENALGYFRNNTAISPGDPGYLPTTMAEWNDRLSNDATFSGAYVDLACREFSGTPAVPTMAQDFSFASFPNTATRVDFPRTFVSYGTWPLSYERDGIDQDSHAGADQGSNGIDDNDIELQPGAGNMLIPINGVDDDGERETQPPYDVALSGIEVRIRMLEFSTGQVRQASVVGDFTD